MYVSPGLQDDVSDVFRFQYFITRISCYHRRLSRYFRRSATALVFLSFPYLLLQSSVSKMSHPSKHGKRSGSQPPHASQMSKLARQVHQLVKEHRVPEKKTYTLLSAPVQAAQNFSGIITELAPIAQGTGLTNRVGDAVNVESIDMKSMWYANQSGTLASMGRTIIFMDTMNTGTAPSSTDILDSVAVGTALAPLANWNVPNNHMHRFRIYLDHTAPFGISGNNAFSHTNRHIKVNRRMDFSGSASTTALRNRLYLLTISDTNSNDNLFSCQVNVNFTDE